MLYIFISIVDALIVILLCNIPSIHAFEILTFIIRKQKVSEHRINQLLT